MTLGASLVVCGAVSLPGPAQPPPLFFSPRSRTPVAAPPAPPAPACAADADCGYDPDGGRCVADPRANRQPPLTDQGLVCYCDAARCATLRVPPVPCESDASCAVRADPRPHPVAASAAYPHERGRPCRDFLIATTCERTNICTMTHLRCPEARR
jgi:hypothetical protein